MDNPNFSTVVVDPLEGDIPLEPITRSPKLAWFYRYIPEALGGKTEVNYRQFRAIYTKEFSKRLFKILDTDKSKNLSIEEILGGLTKMRSDAESNTEQMDELTGLIFEYCSKKTKEVNQANFHRMMSDGDLQRNVFQLMKKTPTDLTVTVSDILTSLESLHNSTTDEKYFLWMSKVLSGIAPTDNEITLKDLKKVIGASQDLMPSRMFYVLSENQETIRLYVLLKKLRKIFLGTKEEKLLFLFNMYDLDGNGTLSRDELEQILTSSVKECAISFTTIEVHHLSNIMWDVVSQATGHIHGNKGCHSDEELSFEQFKAGLEEFPELLETLSISASSAMKPRSRSSTAVVKKTSRRQTLANYFSNNISLVVFTILLILVNIALGIEAASRYWGNSNRLVVVARFYGQLLNFNSALILIFVCRHFLTFIRGTQLAHYLPIDSALTFHKRIATFIFVASLIHTIMHIVNFTTTAQQPGSNFTAVQYLFTTTPNIGWVAGSASITGWILLVLLLCITITAMPFVRRSGKFQVFYWTHQLFICYEIVVILHGPNFWKWIIAPAAIYIVDKILRLRWINQMRYGTSIIKTATICPSKVVFLEISRHTHFNFHAGDYVFVNIPKICNTEWHPFTISSAPELTDSFWLHIRSAGNWTNKLYETVKEGVERAKQNPTSITCSRVTCSLGTMFQQKAITAPHCHLEKDEKEIIVACTDMGPIYINGPYGSPSGHIFYTEHAVLIGTGIGVTPFASILQSIFYRFLSKCFVCPNCGTKTAGDALNTFSIKRVDFFWINRTHNAFEWFMDILRQMEDESLVNPDATDAFLGLHLFLTGTPVAVELKAAALRVALEMAYKKLKKDALSGLQTRIEYGRPDWRKEFEEIRKRNVGKVTIFFCGLPILARQLQKLSNEHDFEFRQEIF